MADLSSDEARAHCAQCQKSAGSDELKVCANCRSTRYCSRECQKTHWKTHKKECATASGGGMFASHISIDPASVAGNRTRGGPSARGPVESPLDLDRMLATFSGNFGSDPPKVLRDAAYLNSLPRKKASKVIIDSYRLRVEDEHTFQAKNRGLYGDEDPFPDFVQYLDDAEKKGGILPQWWNGEARRECERRAQDAEGDCFVGHAVQKQDVIDQYKDRLAPMRLRMIAQLVEGSRVA